MNDVASDTDHENTRGAATSPYMDDVTSNNEGFENLNDGDDVGMIANFIRTQPLLTLSLAFGLGLLATSFLARKKA